MNAWYQPVKCCRCRFEHMESERIRKPRSSGAGGLQISDTHCPKCNGKSFFELREQFAWCWSSGLIEFGDAVPAPRPDGSGAIEIARGPKFALKAQICVVARHGKGESAGCWLVPGVPEAEGQKAKGDALAAFLKWCSSRKPKDGVVFAREFT